MITVLKGKLEVRGRDAVEVSHFVLPPLTPSKLLIVRMPMGAVTPCRMSVFLTFPDDERLGPDSHANVPHSPPSPPANPSMAPGGIFDVRTGRQCFP